MMFNASSSARRRVLLGFATVWLSCQPYTGLAQSVETQSDWSTLDARVEQVYAKGDLQAAIAAAREALAAARKPLERAQSLGQLGFILHASGKSAEAEPHLLESLAIREKEAGTNSLDYAQAIHDLAVLYRDTDRRRESMDHCRRATEIRDRTLPETDRLRAQTYDTCSSIYMAAGEYATALKTLTEAARLHELIPREGPAIAEYGVYCINTAGAYQRLGRFTLAQETFLKGREALAIYPGKQHLAYLIGTLSLASAKSELGLFSEAKPLFDEVMTVLREKFPDQIGYYATALNNRGSMHRALGLTDLAERDFRETVALRSKARPDRKTVGIAATLGNLARLIFATRPVEAENLLREAASTMAELKGPPYEQANILIALAHAEHTRGATTEAEANVRQALTLVENTLTDQHPLYAAALNELGEIYLAGGGEARAEEVFKDALGRAERAYDPKNPHLLVFLRPLARLYEQRGDGASALAIHRRAFEIDDAFLNDVFKVGSEPFKETALRSLSDPVHALIDFQARFGDSLSGARVLAFEAATRHKGRLQEQVRSWRQRLHDAVGTPTPEIAQLQAIGRCRFALSHSLSERKLTRVLPGECELADTDLKDRGYAELLGQLTDKGWQPGLAGQAISAIVALREREHALEAALIKDRPEAAAPPPATLAAIAAALQPDEQLVELIAYPEPRDAVTEHAGGKSKASGNRMAGRYSAFVLGRDGTLSWIDLGSVTQVRDEVTTLLETASDWALSVRRAEDASVEKLQTSADEALDEIAQQVWAPIESILDARPGTRRLRLAPDSALNLVPFDALRGRAGQRLIDRFTIAYVPAGRDLLRPQRAISSNPPVIIVSADGAGPKSQFSADVLPPLPRTAAEARALKGRVRELRIFEKQQGSEEAIKALVSPSWLLVAGHAVILTDQLCPSPPCDENIRRLAGTAMTSPVLILAEAYLPTSASTEDGLLTATELQDVDLRGTALLVLSQCQMASGLHSMGEGVYGMRRAADIAGAHTFVAPLWPVEDAVQSRLMRGFYTRLLNGSSRADALREAKLAVRAARGSRSFLYWAPVILSGDATPLVSR